MSGGCDCVANLLPQSLQITEPRSARDLRLKRAMCCLPQQARRFGNSHLNRTAIEIDCTRGSNHARSGEKSTPRSRDALPHRGPARRQPFLALTKEYSPKREKHCPGASPSTVFSLLVATYFVGTYILAFFGISLPVVQVGGGLIVIATGWTLLKQGDDEKQDVQETVRP